MLFIFQKEGQGFFETQIKNIANEKGLYSDELEAILANDIEKSANPVLQKLREFQSITQEEKIQFSRYVYSMWLRVPKHLNWTIEKSPMIIGKTFSGFEAQLKELAILHPDKESIIAQRIEQLHNIQENETNEIARKMWLKNIPVGIDRPPVKTLADMDWCFLESTNESFFITSDNPLFFFEDIGIGNKTSEVTFPISKNLVLWAKWNMNIQPGFHIARTQFVKEVNRRTIKNSLKYVFSPNEAEWISTLMNKKNIRLNRVI
jgi:hypothetical protein